MTPEEAGDIDTERRLEEWREKEWEKKQKRRALPLSKRPKSGKMKTFHVTFEVPEEYWNAMANGLGFTEADLPGVFAENFCQLVDQAPEQNDLPDMLAGSIRDISDQVGHVATKFVER